MQFMTQYIRIGNTSGLINTKHGEERRRTQRAPDAGDSAAISSSFLRLSIFLAGRLRRPRPSAGNANRWATQEQKQSHL